MSKTNVFTRISAYALVTMAVLLFGAACGSRCAIELEGPGLWVGQIIAGQPSFAPSWSEDGETIVFGYLANVYVVDAFGTEVRKWIPHGAPDDEDFAFDLGPVVTSKAADPAGGDTTSRIVFYTLRHSKTNFDIGTANLDGSDYRRLTDTGADVLPVWSPDGNRIAFLSSRPGSRSPLYVMDTGGSNVVSVGRLPSSVSARPIWSPDGRHIAVRSAGSLYVVTDVLDRAVDSLKLIGGLSWTDPAWSPDGRRIAFVLTGPTAKTVETVTVYTSKPDGSDAQKVVQFDAQSVFSPDDWNLSWRPDGLSLRFSFAPTDSRYGLYQIGVDGSDLQEVCELDRKAKITWSPDGDRAAISHIGDAFAKYQHGDVLLYTMASDGSDRRVLVRQGLDGPEAANGE